MAEASMGDPAPDPADGEAERWIGVGEAARILHVHLHTVRRHADRGRIPHVKTLSGRFRFRRCDVEELAIAGGFPRSALDQEPAQPGRRRREGARDVNGHVRPQRSQRLVPRLAWPEVRIAGEGTALSGPGWRARVVPAGAGWAATLRFDTGEELHWPANPMAEPKTLDRCKRWVRSSLEVAANPGVRVRRRGEAPAIPRQGRASR
ncbi:MAG: helix-turn-helix domain-containing protein [Actinomycetota bacterium]